MSFRENNLVCYRPKLLTSVEFAIYELKQTDTCTLTLSVFLFVYVIRSMSIVKVSIITLKKNRRLTA